jgi:hypothetical protein
LTLTDEDLVPHELGLEALREINLKYERKRERWVELI